MTIPSHPSPDDALEELLTLKGAADALPDKPLSVEQVLARDRYYRLLDQSAGQLLALARSASELQKWLTKAHAENDALTEKLQLANDELARWQTFGFAHCGPPITCDHDMREQMAEQWRVLAREASEAKAKLERLESALRWLDHNGSSHTFISRNVRGNASMQPEHLLDAAIVLGWRRESGAQEALPGDLDNDPDQMLGDGDPGEP